MATTESLDALIIRRTLRVPDPPAGATHTEPEAADVARYFDIALLSEGFTASYKLLERMQKMAAAEAKNWAASILTVIQEMVGSHAQHNSYFIDFPENVPQTEE